MRKMLFVLLILVFFVNGSSIHHETENQQGITIPFGTCVCNSKTTYSDPWMCPYPGKQQAVEKWFWKDNGGCSNNGMCWSPTLQKYQKCGLCVWGYGKSVKDTHRIFWSHTCHSKLMSVVELFR